MEELAQRILNLIEQGSRAMKSASNAELTFHSRPGKWSKKEILGHLIDSAIYNLQRFTEIQFKDQPFQILRYNQDELVAANGYNKISTAELVSLWSALNIQIGNVISRLTKDQFSYKIILPDGESSDLHFLVLDYIIHLEHHVLQLTK